MKHITYLLLTILLFSCSKEECGDGSIELQACFDNNIEYSQNDQLFIEYIENRTYWECLNISKYKVSYEVYIRECYGGTLRITVEDDEIIEEEVIDPGQQQSPRCEGNGRTIDFFYFVVETAVDSMTMFDDLHVAYRAEVSYDPIIHFPDTIDIDWDFGVADDEFYAILKDFEEIK